MEYSPWSRDKSHADLRIRPACRHEHRHGALLYPQGAARARDRREGRLQPLSDLHRGASGGRADHQDGAGAGLLAARDRGAGGGISCRRDNARTRPGADAGTARAAGGEGGAAERDGRLYPRQGGVAGKRAAGRRAAVRGIRGVRFVQPRFQQGRMPGLKQMRLGFHAVELAEYLQEGFAIGRRRHQPVIVGRWKRNEVCFVVIGICADQYALLIIFGVIADAVHIELLAFPENLASDVDGGKLANGDDELAWSDRIDGGRAESFRRAQIQFVQGREYFLEIRKQVVRPYEFRHSSGCAGFDLFLDFRLFIRGHGHELLGLQRIAALQVPGIE
ncbi:conserved hypothetical protein [Ricinus communis]|uniref:Uncharacterized protein n=1 Tax=Ricinus communis TaxID=3988 RepID=B9TFD6_RICCO|nr:conserved hypothetical protein [Ricinus communis]